MSDRTTRSIVPIGDNGTVTTNIRKLRRNAESRQRRKSSSSCTRRSSGPSASSTRILARAGPEIVASFAARLRIPIPRSSAATVSPNTAPIRSAGRVSERSGPVMKLGRTTVNGLGPLSSAASTVARRRRALKGRSDRPQVSRFSRLRRRASSNQDRQLPATRPERRPFAPFWRAPL